MSERLKTVLVTGATGIIGRHAVNTLLANGVNAVAIARGGFERVPLKCEMRRIDLLDREATQAAVREIKPDGLLHLAWISAHGRFWNSPENLDWLASSVYLLRAFAEAGGQRVVAAGTCVEYDCSRPITSRIDESKECRPATFYGWAKHGLRQVLAAYAQEAGLKHAWGRLFLLYGEDEPQQRLAPTVARALLRGLPAECTSGNQVRDFLDTRDAGAAFAKLLLSTVDGPVNICSGEAISIADFAGRIAKIIGRPELLRLGALPDRPDDPPYLVGDPSRLTHEVGFAPAIPLDQGLRDTVARWRRQMGLA